jgi:hypothetical protein
MGERKNRTIVNIGSFAGIDSRPSCGIYSASKHGPKDKSPILVSATRHSHFTAMTESLSKGVAPFNMTCFIVEPCGFRTNFLDAFTTPAKGLAFLLIKIQLLIKPFKRSKRFPEGSMAVPIKDVKWFSILWQEPALQLGKRSFWSYLLALIVQPRFKATAESLLKTLDGLEDVLLLTDDDEQFDFDKIRSKAT